MSTNGQVMDLLAEQVSDVGTQWSVGAFGGIAEFSRDPGETVSVATSAERVSAFTSRGGVAITAHADIRPFASESITRHGWSHRVSLCLPEAVCAMNRRAVLTEVGPDADALREQDRAGVLFDLGLDLLHVDLCVRIADADVIAKVREYLGRPIFEDGNPVMGIIMPASPHRVFISRIGRVEVFQPIPPPTGKSPEGPHTHVLPKMLKSKRTHAATEPVPAGWVPCAHFYPAHPALDGMGMARPFDPASHDAFQAMLRLLGSPDSIAIKQQVVAAVENEQPPIQIDAAQDRVTRTTLRVALRQLKIAGHPSKTLPAWCEAFDRADPAEDEDENAKAYGH